jgi:hypothetical protein
VIHCDDVFEMIEVGLGDLSGATTEKDAVLARNHRGAGVWWLPDMPRAGSRGIDFEAIRETGFLD